MASPPIVPPDLAPELVRLRWEERWTYTQLTAHYPGYSRGALANAIRRASHRDHYQPECAWCRKRFRTQYARQRFCRPGCRESHWRFHHDMETATRPPEDLRGRICAAGNCDNPLPEWKRAGAVYCSMRCSNRGRRTERRRKGVQGG